MSVNIFQNSTSKVPKGDDQIVRVDLSRSDIGGRPSQIPSQQQSSALALSHVSSNTIPGK